jgi:hypothetical protein
MLPHTFSQRVLKLLTVLVVFALTTLAVIVSQEKASNINSETTENNHLSMEKYQLPCCLQVTVSENRCFGFAIV